MSLFSMAATELIWLLTVIGTTMTANTAESIETEFAKNLFNVTLKVVTIHRPPFIILKLGDPSKKEILKATGFCMEMLNVISKKFGFRYVLELPYDNNWGSPLPNGTYTGMIGMVQTRRVDLAVASFTLTKARDSVIDFTYPFFEEPTGILLPYPKEQTPLFAFMEPFQFQVWILTLISTIIVGVIMWSITVPTGGVIPLSHPYAHIRSPYSIMRYIFDCGVALVEQGDIPYHNNSSRLLYSVWWLFCGVLIYTYTSILIAFLTVPKLAKVINSLDELANQEDILWTFRASTAHQELFNQADSGAYQKIGQLINKKPELLVATDAQGVETVVTKNMAFIKEKSFLDVAMEADYRQSNQCRLIQAKETFFSAGIGWVFPDNSPYIPFFDKEFVRMRQSGLFTVWQRKYWPKPNECTSGSLNSAAPKSLKLMNLSGNFLIILVGTSVSALAFLVEKAYKKSKFSFKSFRIKNIFKRN